jgi:proteasome lid subunit RPN8/RPN11
VLGIAVGLLPVLLIGAPGSVQAIGSLGATFTDGGPTDQAVEANGSIYVQQDDASFMSRIYAERDHEIAYCGAIQERGGRPVLTVWLADTVSASPESISFSAANCPPAMKDVFLHTHPSGALGLSRQDMDLFQRFPDSISCVQGGRLQGDPGERVENLACYRQVEQDGDEFELATLPVVFDYEGSDSS